MISEITSYTKGEALHCPHCQKSEGDPIEYYIVPMKIGQPEKEQCGWCNGYFYVTEVEKDKFEVEPVK